MLHLHLQIAIANIQSNCKTQYLFLFFYEDNKQKVRMPHKLYHGYIGGQVDHVDHEGSTFVW